MHVSNKKRSQLAIEPEEAHNAPFISLVLLRAEMVKRDDLAQTWFCTHWERVQPYTFSTFGNLSEHEEVLMYDTHMHSESLKVDKDMCSCYGAVPFLVAGLVKRNASLAHP